MLQNVDLYYPPQDCLFKVPSTKAQSDLLNQTFLGDGAQESSHLTSELDDSDADS